MLDDAAVDGETIREHAQTCARCRRLLEETSDTVGALREVQPEPLEHDLVDGVLARIPESAWKDRFRAIDSPRTALAWMSGTVNGNGYFGYERPQPFPEGPKTLTMMGAHCLLSAKRLDIPIDPALVARVTQGMCKLARENPDDYYGAYFYSSALSEADPEAFGDAPAEARSTVIARQQASGMDTGTWAADDRWASAGGQLYSTSMAMLALTAPHSHAAALGEF